MHTIAQHSKQTSSHSRVPFSFASISQTFAGKAAVVFGASIFVAICAHLTVPLPFTPVPLTLGDLAVLLVGLALSPSLAFAALALYLAEGAAGLPVFAPGVPGVAHFLTASGGYLIAYPFAAATASFLAGALKALPRYAAGFIGAFAGSTLIMASGAAWFSLFLHHSAALILPLAVLPFLPGQLVKIFAAAGVYSAINPSRRS